MRGALLWAGLGLLVAAFPAAAEAELMLSGDVNGVVRLRNTDEQDIKLGLAGRLGYRIGELGQVTVTPEGMFAWERFGDDANNLIRVVGGLRIAGGNVFQPSVFGHVGWGRRNFSGTHENGTAVDGGVALDLQVGEPLMVGVHGAYNLILLDESIDFVSFGAHFTIAF